MGRTFQETRFSRSVQDPILNFHPAWNLRRQPSSHVCVSASSVSPRPGLHVRLNVGSFIFLQFGDFTSL